MRKIPVSEVRNGMVLGREILDDRGRILLKKGDPLREGYIRKLEDWGVTEVCIAPADGEQGESDDEVDRENVVVPLELTEKYEKTLDEKFSDYPDNVMMNKIKKSAVNTLALKEARRREEA